MKPLKRLTVLTSDGPELYVQVDAEGVALAQMCDRLRADLEAVTAERDELQRKLEEMTR